MTREEIIEALQRCTQDPSSGTCAGCTYEKVGDTFKECCMALMLDCLEVLKAQEPSQDWISRERLKNELKYYIDEAGWTDEINQGLTWCLEFIDHQEAVKWE